MRVEHQLGGAFFLTLALVVAGAAAHGQEETPDPSYERERLQHVAQAPTFEEAMQWMTPEELAGEYGIANDPRSAQGDEPTVHFVGGAYLRIDVNVGSQTLTMTGTHTQLFSERVSTGKNGYGTPRGCYSPTDLSRDHWSRRYQSPMPWAVFFHRGYALHQTPYVKNLGRRASHGCVRQSGPNARYVYQTVEWYVSRFGRGSVSICVR